MMWKFLLLVAACLLDSSNATTVADVATDASTTTTPAPTTDASTTTTPAPTTTTLHSSNATAAADVATDAPITTTPALRTTTLPPITPVVTISENHNSELGYTFSWAPVEVVTNTTAYTVTYSDGSTTTTVPTEQTAQTTVGITFPDYATSYVVTVTAKTDGSTESSPATKRIVTMPSDPTSPIVVTQSTAVGQFNSPGDRVEIVVVSEADLVDAGFNAIGLNPGTKYSASFRARYMRGGPDELSSPDRIVTYTTLEISSPLEESNFTISPMSNSIKVQWTSDAVTDRIVLSLDDSTGACLDQKSYNCSNCGIQTEISSISPPRCHQRSSVSFESGQSLTVDFLSLSAATEYTLNIVAETTDGLKTVTDGTTIRTTDSAPGKPFHLILTAYSINQNMKSRTLPNVTATWQRPAMTNGKLSQYTVTARGQYGAEDVTVNVTDPQLLLEETLTTSLSPLKAFTVYSVSVMATGEMAGEGPSSDAQQITTQETVPTAPQNVAVVPSLLSATVTWDLPKSPNGDIIKYRVKVVVTSRVVYSEDIDSRQTGRRSANIDKLRRNTDYQLIVSGWTIFGEGDLSRFYFRTKQVPRKVRNLRVIQYDHFKRVEITWSAPKLHKGLGKLSYLPTLYNSETRERTNVCRSGWWNKLVCRLPYSSLVAGTIYNVEVVAQNTYGLGEVSTTDEFRLAAVPYQRISYMTEPSSDPTQSTITFEIPAFLDILFQEEQGGAVIRILRYEVLVVAYSNRPDRSYSASVDDYPPSPVTWKESYASGFKKQYSALGGVWLGKNQQTTSITIGSEGSCNGDCNGPLADNEQFCISLRLFTSTHFLDTECMVTAVTKLNLVPVLVPPVLIGVVVIVTFIVLLYLWYNKKCCIKAFNDTGTVNTVRFVANLPPGSPQVTQAPQAAATLKTSKPMRVRDFHAHVEVMHRDSNSKFAVEYKMLKEASPKLPRTAAAQNQNVPKNRYTDIRPFDHSRVKLKIMENEEPTNDYINANFLPGFNSKREYIAAQGPLPGTIDDFWHMVWDQNVTTIVMLTNIMEKGKRKCEFYWPEGVGERKTYGDITVTLRSIVHLPEYYINLFNMKMDGQRRIVKHFFYTQWPDWGCPGTPDDLVNFVQLVRTHRRSTTDGPIVVHCSAGVGRTGTFVAVDHILQHIRQHDVIDVVRVVRGMRGARCNMVQTGDQYVYVHDCIAWALNQGMSPFFKPPPIADRSSKDFEEPIYETLTLENIQPRRKK